MAVKKYGSNVLNALLEQFQVPGNAYSIRPINQGFINDTFLVSNDGLPRYVLQRINDNVFSDVVGLMDNIENALGCLKGDSYRSIELVPHKNGTSFLQDDAYGYWRLMTYIDNSKAYDTTNNSSIAQEAGRIIGRFHVLLQEANPATYVDTIPRFHDLGFRRDQFVEALKNTSPKKSDIAERAIHFAKEMLQELADWNGKRLPLRVCHNDTKLNNILFSTTNHEALCLIDLDTLMKGYFLYDFGDAIRTIVNTAAEDERDHSKIVFEKGLFEAFIAGLARNEPFLSKAEIASLPLGVILMPFLHGIRALTDFLNGNIYYKVTYENQNLDRCMSLFDFAKKALEQRSWMAETVLKRLNPTDV